MKAPEAQCSDWTEQEKLLLAYVEKARIQNPPVYLGLIAMMCTSVDDPIPIEVVDSWVGTYTRGDFKRAIKHLRESEKACPQNADLYGPAIPFIRSKWLHRKD